jgi:hypothetical protein
MIDYKYPTIASEATPIGSAGRAPDEELFWEEQGKKIRVHGLNIYSHWESGFKNPKILAIAFEVEGMWSRRLKKSKIEEIEDFKKSKFWRNWSLKKSKIEELRELKKSKIEVLRLNPSLQLELSLGGYWHGYALRVPTD